MAEPGAIPRPADSNVTLWAWRPLFPPTLPPPHNMCCASLPFPWNPPPKPAESYTICTIRQSLFFFFLNFNSGLFVSFVSHFSQLPSPTERVLGSLTYKLVGQKSGLPGTPLPRRGLKRLGSEALRSRFFMLESDLEADTQPGENPPGLEMIWTQQLCHFNTWMFQNSGNMSYLHLLVCFCLYTSSCILFF